MNFDYQKRITTPMNDEPVGKLLGNLHMESAFFTQSTLREPWAIQIPPLSGCMMFHIVVNGAATFKTDSVQTTLKTGDFILFPKGEGHSLTDGRSTDFTHLGELPIIAVTERFETLDFGGSGDKTEMVCGVLLFQHPLAIKLLDILPSQIVIRREEASSFNTIENISQLLESESKTIGVGAEAVIARLSDIMVIQAMRKHLTSLDDNQLGWLVALNDERIGNALELLHADPANQWSLGELGRKVGMSRTSFAQQFKLLVGNTPMEYLTEWRMSLAYSKLQLSGDSILAIALDVGYQSEAAFSRAFKKVIGKCPNEIRKQNKVDVN